MQSGSTHTVSLSAHGIPAESVIPGFNEGEGSSSIEGGMNLSVLCNLHEIHCETSAQVRRERHTAMMNYRETCADL